MPLIDTPQSISVITSDMMDITNARSVYEAVDMVPGVDRGGVGGGLEYLSIRGNTVISGRINGIQLSAVDFPDTYALERVEIVRGPATVLYGVTTSFTGEVNNIFKSPQRGFQAQTGIEAGDPDSIRYEFDVTGSIPSTNDRLQGRLVAAYREYGMYAENVDSKNHNKMVSASVGYDFTPNTRGEFYFYGERNDLDPGDEGCTLVWNGGPTLSLPDFVDSEHYYCGFQDGNNADSGTEIFLASLEHHFANDWTFKSDAAWSWSYWDLSYYFPFGPAGAYDLNDNEVYLYTYDYQEENHELTFNLSLGGDFELFGREHEFFTALQVVDTLNPIRRYSLQSGGVGFLDLRDGGLGILADGSPIPLVDRDSLPIVSDHGSGYRHYRGSLQVLLNPTDRLAILAGLQVQDSEILSRDNLSGAQFRSDFTETVPRFGVTYDLVDGWGAMDDLRAYYSYSEGFKPNVGLFDENQNPLDEPQTMESNEVGLKGEFLDGKVGATIAWYESEITNLPISIIVPGGIDEPVTRLEGLRKFDGLEFEVIGELLPGWNVALNYTNSRGKIIDPGHPGLELLVRSLPENQGAVFTSYEFLKGPLRGLRVGGAVVYRDDYPMVDDFPDLVAAYGQLIDSGYTRFDLNFSYAGFTGKLEGLEIYGNIFNVNDVDYFLSREGHPGFAINHGNPRSISVGIRYMFGNNAR